MMTKEGCTKNLNFMSNGAGALVLGCGHLGHCSEYVLSSTLSVYSHWLNYYAAYLYHCWYIFTLMGLLICKYKPFWQEVSVKSMILRWPLRPAGLLFSFENSIQHIEYNIKYHYFFQISFVFIIFHNFIAFGVYDVYKYILHHVHMRKKYCPFSTHHQQ